MRITDEVREQIENLLLHGKSYREISRLLGVGFGSVSRVSTMLDLSQVPVKRGRPRSLSSAEEKKIVEDFDHGKSTSAEEATREFKRITGRSLSSNSIRAALKRDRLRARVMKKKPVLKAIYRKKRLAFARRHSDDTIDDWNRVLWSDE